MKLSPIEIQNEISRLANAFGTGVYVVGSRGLIKIGRTRNIDRRFPELQVASPYKLTLLHFERCGERAAEIEKNAHRLLGPWRYKGEWFTASLRVALIAIDAVRYDMTQVKEFFGLARDAAIMTDPKRKRRMNDRIRNEFPDLWMRVFAHEDSQTPTVEEIMPDEASQPPKYLVARQRIRQLARLRSTEAQFAGETARYQLRLASRGHDSPALRESLAANIELLKAA